MAKKIRAMLKLQRPPARDRGAAGGPALGQHGINIMEFIKAFNERHRRPARLRRPGRDHRLRGPLVHVRHEGRRRPPCS